MITADVIVPRSNNMNGREHGLSVVQRFYMPPQPGWNVLFPVAEPFSRAAAINQAAETSAAEVLVFNDADTLVPVEQLEDAIMHAAEGALAWAYTVFCRLNERDSAAVSTLADCEDCNPYEVLQMPPSLSVSAISRENYELCGGYDPRFVGWGYEDMAFAVACKRAGIPFARVDGPLFHLHHPPAAGSDLSGVNSVEEQANRALFEREYSDV